MFSFPHDPLTTEQIYRRHGNWLQGWLQRRLNCSETAADLMQDTFVRLLKKPQKLVSDGEARAFLSTVAKGLCVDHWRRRQIEQSFLETLTHNPFLTEPSAEHRALIIETLCELDAWLCRLPVKVANAFILSQLKGMTYREIAEQLGVSERMVKRYMAQAMMECVLIESTLDGVLDAPVQEFSDD